jgi:hypothetical protein
MSGANGQSSSVKLGIKEKPVQRSRECKLRNGSLQMNVSMKPSGRPSLPVTRCRLFKNAHGS